VSPVVARVHVKEIPTLTDSKLTGPEAGADTTTGVALLVNVPWPSWPELFNPQQYMAPPTATPQVWARSFAPSEMLPYALTDRNSTPPETATGLEASVVVPSPSWPNTFCPQQNASPPVVTPQECALPAASAAKAREMPKAELVLVKLPDDATSVYPLPGRSMLKLA
jgi:hypothetical protein